MSPIPTDGDPLYEAQNSDFLKRKVADLRKIWRNKRNCAKKKYLRKFDVCVDVCGRLKNPHFFFTNPTHASRYAADLRKKTSKFKIF